MLCLLAAPLHCFFKILPAEARRGNIFIGAKARLYNENTLNHFISRIELLPLPGAPPLVNILADWELCWVLQWSHNTAPEGVEEEEDPRPARHRQTLCVCVCNCWCCCCRGAKIRTVSYCGATPNIRRRCIHRRRDAGDMVAVSCPPFFWSCSTHHTLTPRRLRRTFQLIFVTSFGNGIGGGGGGWGLLFSRSRYTRREGFVLSMPAPRVNPSHHTPRGGKRKERRLEGRGFVFHFVPEESGLWCAQFVFGGISCCCCDRRNNCGATIAGSTCSRVIDSSYVLFVYFGRRTVS